MRAVRISIVVIAVLIAGAFLFWPKTHLPPIRIGILHSLTGNLALHERPLVDALTLAIEQINQSGGLLGRRVEPVIVDCRSDAELCGREAENLIVKQKVSALFGCWTSSCRKAIKPVVEHHHHLLFYPLQYEGMEQSPNILYLGAAPNQQLIPGVRWALDHLGKRFYLLGSDYVFPRTANLVMKDMILSQGGEVLGERCVPLDSHDLSAAIADIKRLKPDVVLNTINGDANVAFFTALAQAGLTAEQLPVMSFSVAEIGAQAMPNNEMAGHYAVWSYFQSIPGKTNQRFIADVTQRFGTNHLVTDPMEASWIGIQLWKQAVLEAGSADPDKVNLTLPDQSMNAPEGIVSVHKANRHLWKSVRIGRARPDDQFDILWSSSFPVAPEPYPLYRSIHEWQKIVGDAEIK